MRQFSDFRKVKWVLFNTFDKLEEEVLSITFLHYNVISYILVGMSFFQFSRHILKP